MPRISARDPTQSLKPVGLPSASSRILAMNSTSSRGVLNTLCAGGLMTFTPTGTPRIAAISGVTFAPGSTPPMPGFAPWLSFSSTHLICGSAALSRNLSGSKWPSAVRAPK
jgi:hypothetical protein